MAKGLTTKILIEIRDDLRSVKAEAVKTNERLDQTNERLDETIQAVGRTNEKLAVLAMITKGIDTRLERMETQHVFLPRRVDMLEQKLLRIEERLGPED